MKLMLYMIILSLSTTVFAQDFKVLVGAEFGQSKSKWEDHTGEWENNFGLRVGGESDDSRIYLSYNYVEIKDFIFVNTNYESHTTHINFDAKTDKYYKFLRAFVGVHLGALYSQWDLGQNPNTDDKKDDIDFIYGAKAGLIIDIINNAYLEAGFKYSLTNASSDSINPSDIMNYYGSVNFKF